jgi:hypothetical protein
MKIAQVRRFATALAVTVTLALTALRGAGAIAAEPVGKCGYYQNSGGHEVPRPCGNWRSDPRPPSGATAECRDGTLSWSEHPHAPGTCSHHGGVAKRL